MTAEELAALSLEIANRAQAKLILAAWDRAVSAWRPMINDVDPTPEERYEYCLAYRALPEEFRELPGGVARGA